MRQNRHQKAAFCPCCAFFYSLLLLQNSTIRWLNQYWFNAFFFSIQNKFRVTLFFKENFWKKLHFKLLLNTRQAIPHLHNETYGGLNILGKKNHPHKYETVTEVFSQIFFKRRCSKGKCPWLENIKLRLLFSSRIKSDRNGHTQTLTCPVYIQVLWDKGWN